MGGDVWGPYWRDVGNHDWWKRPAPEVIDFIRSQSPAARQRVLDLGCGLGRHAIAFALAGYEVSATDSSEEAMGRLRAWTRELDLSISSHVCDMLAQPFPPSTFDIVLAYNVIYHGQREQFARAIRLVWGLLRPGGLFFFTCPTREDGKYGHGKCVAAHTYASTRSVTPGDVHYFADLSDFAELLADFEIQAIRKDEGRWNNSGQDQFFSNWQVLAEKGQGA